MSELADSDLAIRPPLQRRSREAWARVLDAGVELLEQGGYEAFTISAVCERADVAPRAIYARADSKDALFLAVYEHGMARLRADELVLADPARMRGLDGDEATTKAVRHVAGMFRRHAALLRSVVLISGVHPEINRRGSRYVRSLGDTFTARLLDSGVAVGRPDREASVRAVFDLVFSALVIRTAYGPGFSGPAVSDRVFVDGLCRMSLLYLAED